MSLSLIIRRQPAQWARLQSPSLATRACFAGHGWPFSPVFDAVETETGYEVTAELPGVEAADIEVVVEEGVLSLCAERKREASEGQPARSLGRFERSIRFPAAVDDAAVTARHRNGVLTIHVPKLLPPAAELRSIPIETV